MAVLITGGAGYIGSHMAHLLSDFGRSVIVLDDLSTGFAWAVPKSARFVRGDIADRGLLDDLMADGTVEAVVHFAGSIIVPESVENPLKYYLNNTAKTRGLIEACVENGVKRFIFSSTAAVYGMPERSPIDETSPLAPISPYGSSKLMSEIMLRDVASAHDFRYVALRYFNVAGGDPEQRTGQSTANATHLIKICSQVALGQRSQLTVFGTDYPTPDGTCVRDYIHVTDLADAHRLALDHLSAGGESLVLNCGYGHGFSVREVVTAMEEVTGRALPVVEAARRAGDPAALVSDPSALKQRLGWTPRFDNIGVIIGHALAWEDRLAKMSRTTS